MNSDETRLPDPLDRLRALGEAARPSYTETELDSGFARLVAVANERKNDPVARREAENSVLSAKIGLHSYALATQAFESSDLDEAERWLRIALDHGIDRAEQDLNKVIAAKALASAQSAVSAVGPACDRQDRRDRVWNRRLDAIFWYPALASTVSACGENDLTNVGSFDRWQMLKRKEDVLKHKEEQLERQRRELEDERHELMAEKEKIARARERIQSAHTDQTVVDAKQTGSSTVGTFSDLVCRVTPLYQWRAGGEGLILPDDDVVCMDQIAGIMPIRRRSAAFETGDIFSLLMGNPVPLTGGGVLRREGQSVAAYAPATAPGLALLFYTQAKMWRDDTSAFADGGTRHLYLGASTSLASLSNSASGPMKVRYRAATQGMIYDALLQRLRGAERWHTQCPCCRAGGKEPIADWSHGGCTIVVLTDDQFTHADHRCVYEKNLAFDEIGAEFKRWEPAEQASESEPTRLMPNPVDC